MRYMLPLRATVSTKRKYTAQKIEQLFFQKCSTALRARFCFAFRIAADLFSGLYLYWLVGDPRKKIIWAPHLIACCFQWLQKHARLFFWVCKISNTAMGLKKSLVVCAGPPVDCWKSSHKKKKNLHCKYR